MELLGCLQGQPGPSPAAVLGDHPPVHDLHCIPVPSRIPRHRALRRLPVQHAGFPSLRGPVEVHPPYSLHHSLSGLVLSVEIWESSLPVPRSPRALPLHCAINLLCLHDSNRSSCGTLCLSRPPYPYVPAAHQNRRLQTVIAHGPAHPARRCLLQRVHLRGRAHVDAGAAARGAAAAHRPPAPLCLAGKRVPEGGLPAAVALREGRPHRVSCCLCPRPYSLSLPISTVAQMRMCSRLSFLSCLRISDTRHRSP